VESINAFNLKKISKIVTGHVEVLYLIGVKVLNAYDIIIHSYLFILCLLYKTPVGICTMGVFD